MRSGCSRTSERREEELDIWARTLTCGHKVEQSVHHTNREPSFSTQWCPECEITRGVVTSEKVVEAAARMVEANRRRDEKIARAEREVKKAKKAAVAPPPRAYEVAPPQSGGEVSEEISSFIL